MDEEKPPPGQVHTDTGTCGLTRIGHDALRLPRSHKVGSRGMVGLGLLFGGCIGGLYLLPLMGLADGEVDK